MLKQKILKWSALRRREYEIAIFQTEHPREKKGYKLVYQGQIDGDNHMDVINKLFRTFNIRDLIPASYKGRTISSGDIIMIGSSMGGWLSMLAAIQYPDRVKGFIGLAAAPNFVKYFTNQITSDQKKELGHSGKFKIINKIFQPITFSRSSILIICIKYENIF